MRRKSFTLSLLVLFVAIVSGLPSKATSSHTKHSIASYAKYLEIPAAKPVGSDTCANCHDVVAKNFGHAFHAQQGVECEDCHGFGSLHVDGGGDVSKIVALGKRSAEAANGVCLSCHAGGEKTRHWLGGSHAANHVRCMDCHQIHPTGLLEAAGSQANYDQATRGALTVASVSPETNVIIRPMWQTNEACLKCHPAERAQLSMPYHHPLREGKMSCVDCHDPHGGADGKNLINTNVNQLCLGCHAQYRGPFAYQHPPVSENCLTCHTVHGSPNTNLLTVSEPALCLQCHAGHHDGASLPLADRCTNCHGSIHGTDVPTPSGGSRFLDKGPSEAQLKAGNVSPLAGSKSAARSASVAQPVSAHMPTLGRASIGAAFGLMSSGRGGPLSSGSMFDAGAFPGGGTEEEAGGSSAFSFTPATYRFVDGSGFLGRVGEYDSLSQSAGADLSQAYVSTINKLTVVSRGNVTSGNDYSAATQLTAGEWLQVGLFIRSFVQQQDHYNFYAFPLLDVGATDTYNDIIPGRSVFGVTRRMGNAYARFKWPEIPVHLFVKGNWQARAGSTQFAYLDEQAQPIASSFCGSQCHYQSQLQPVNYTSRNIGGGAQVDVGKFHFTYEHDFSSFNDRLVFPTGNFNGEFDPALDGFGYSNRLDSGVSFRPPSGPTPSGCVSPTVGQVCQVAIGNYFINPTSNSQQSIDTLRLNWTASPDLIFNGDVSYARLLNMFTQHPQTTFNTDDTLIWRPITRLRATVDYHQQNLINNFTPYYSLYGNVSYHNHSAGLKLEYELPKGFEGEAYYKRSGITRSNAALWPQLYSVDNTDLLGVVASSFSNTTGVALRYHDRSTWSGRAGYEWTGTHHPGYLIVPQSNNRVFADVWVTPKNWLVLSNDFSAIIQNVFPDVPLPNTPGATTPTPPTPLTTSFGYNIQGLPPTFQRSNRFYYETLSATFRPVTDLNLSLGYSYQQNNLKTYMAFQNDSAAGYILDEPLVPYKQITQAYWGESSYLYRQRLGVNLRVTYNSSRSGFRPNVNPNDAGVLGNQYMQSTGAFNQAFFGTPGQPICPPGGTAGTALCNAFLSSTVVSQVIVPQWIGTGKLYYEFPRKFEGGVVFYYGSYRDYFNPNLNGVLRTFTIYAGKSW